MSKTDLLNVKLDIFWYFKSRPFPSLSTQACVEGLAFHPHCGWKFVCISHSCGWQVSGDMLAWALKLSCLSNHMISLIIVQLHPNRMFLQFWSSIAVASHELLGSWVRSQWVTSVFLHSESIICFLSSLSPLLDSDFLLASVRLKSWPFLFAFPYKVRICHFLLNRLNTHGPCDPEDDLTERHGVQSVRFLPK